MWEGTLNSGVQVILGYTENSTATRETGDLVSFKKKGGGGVKKNWITVTDKIISLIQKPYRVSSFPMCQQSCWVTGMKRPGEEEAVLESCGLVR